MPNFTKKNSVNEQVISVEIVTTTDHSHTSRYLSGSDVAKKSRFSVNKEIRRFQKSTVLIKVLIQE